jgi:hypothetical protein
LPNLEFKFVAADFVLDLAPELFHDPTFTPYIYELKDIMDNYYTSYGESKDKIKHMFLDKQREISHILNKSSAMTSDMAELLNWNPFTNKSTDWFNPEWMLALTEGFDIVIGNPPYVYNKKIDEQKKQRYKAKYGIIDDLYNYFFVRSFNLTETGGIVSFITSNTYLSISSKQNLRDLFLDNRIIEIIKVDNPFENPMVEPAIIAIQKTEKSSGNYAFSYKNAKESKDAQTGFYDPDEYNPNSEIYKKTAFNTLFVPNEFNMRIWAKYSGAIYRLVYQNWEFINSSRSIDKHDKKLIDYRTSLKPGDITLIGLLTQGGNGLTTGNNGRFVAVREGTKDAFRIKQTRPQKLYEAVNNYNIDELDIDSLQDARNYLSELSEQEIRNKFDELKEDYERDIFGSGYLYKIISDKEIAGAENMTSDEIENGIEAYKPHWVPYDKGDKDGNRWYLRTPYYLDWSSETVKFLVSHSGKGVGNPVIRNKDFYFREGLCWSNVLNPNARGIKCRYKDKSVNDVASMSLFSISDLISNEYLVCLLNSDFMFQYLRDFINDSVNLQINDIRQLPIIIPTKEQLKVFHEIFNSAYAIKLMQFAGEISDTKAEEKLAQIQKDLDAYVLEYYGLN